MARNKKKGSAERSDIPYALRLQMQKHAEITAHREQAVLIAMQIACVALNDTEGLGYTRLCRFAKHAMELMNEYYDDKELNRERLTRRLQQLGFRVEGEHFYGAFDEETGEPMPISKAKRT